MKRRGFLRGASVVGGLSLAGCLDRLGFEEESAWRDPPMVDDRPDAVYLPASTEEMARYGSVDDGEYAVDLSYTFPHRFWTVSGSDTNRVTVGTDDTMHLMCTVWDPQTHTVLPVDMQVEIARDGDVVESYVPWPMLSQRMGFHYGDNVVLPEEGSYTARIQVGPVLARRIGEFDGRFESAATLEIDFDYERADIHELDFELTDHERRGERGALPLMDHGGGGDRHEDGDGSSHEDDDGTHGENGSNGTGAGHPPTSKGVAVDDIPGRLVGTERSADAEISVVVTDLDRLAGDATEYLGVTIRTPHHGIVLPLTSVSAVVERDGEVVFEGNLRETMDHEFGHHYGAGHEGVEDGDRLTVSIDAPPQISRHDGYETAFFDFEDVTVTV